MKSLVVGASAGLGRALSEELAKQGHDLFLIASGREDLEPLAADLRLAHGAATAFLDIDLARPIDCGHIREAVLNALGGLDNLFLVAGLPDGMKDAGPLPQQRLEDVLAVNFTAPVALANAFLQDLLDSPCGNVVGMGSIAAAKARKRNCAYGAGKRGLEFYFQGLRHLLADTACRTQFYRLGYLKTSMTENQRLLLPASAPGPIAGHIVANLGRDLGVAYLPRWWGPVCTAYAALPWTIFRRLDIR